MLWLQEQQIISIETLEVINNESFGCEKCPSHFPGDQVDILKCPVLANHPKSKIIHFTVIEEQENQHLRA